MKEDYTYSVVGRRHVRESQAASVHYEKSSGTGLTGVSRKM
jgi:hypothetical protein